MCWGCMDLISNFGIACVQIPCVYLSCMFLNKVQSTRSKNIITNIKLRFTEVIKIHHHLWHIVSRPITFVPHDAFIKHNITAHMNAPLDRIKKSVALCIDFIAHKDSPQALVIKLGALLCWNMHVGQASPSSEVCHIRSSAKE